MLRRRLLQYPCEEDPQQDYCVREFWSSFGVAILSLILFCCVAGVSCLVYDKIGTFLRRCFCRGVQWPLIISKEEVKKRDNRQVTSQLTCLTSFQEHYSLELRKYYETEPKICGFPESVHIECSDFDAKDDVVRAKFITGFNDFDDLSKGVENPGRYMYNRDKMMYCLYHLEPNPLLEYRHRGRNELVCTPQNQRDPYPIIFSETVKDGEERTGFLRFYHFTKNRPVYPGYGDGGTLYRLISSCDSKTFTLSNSSTA